MINIGILLGSTRPGRRGEQVARWVLDRASRREDATFELVDLLDHPLPFLDEPTPKALGQYSREHTKAWSATIAAFDGYVMVTPEYNHSCSPVLKNAIDYLHLEWHDKAVGFVSYGGVGGARAAEQLRLVCGAVQLADVSPQVALSLATEFADDVLTPGAYNEMALGMTLDHVVAWSTALAPLRAVSPVTVA